MLRYGIPEYRLPKEVLDKEISLIEKMGVKIVYNTKLGEDISLEYLKNNYDAVFIGIGAWKSSSIRCKGEDKKESSEELTFEGSQHQRESRNREKSSSSRRRKYRYGRSENCRKTGRR